MGERLKTYLIAGGLFAAALAVLALLPAHLRGSGGHTALDVPETTSPLSVQAPEAFQPAHRASTRSTTAAKPHVQPRKATATQIASVAIVPSRTVHHAAAAPAATAAVKAAGAKAAHRTTPATSKPAAKPKTRTPEARPTVHKAPKPAKPVTTTTATVPTTTAGTPPPATPPPPAPLAASPPPQPATTTAPALTTTTAPPVVATPAPPTTPAVPAPAPHGFGGFRHWR
jgi:hypothetical protein